MQERPSWPHFSIEQTVRRRTDRQEVLRDQRRTTNESAIHIGLSEELTRVRRLHAAPIEEPQRASNCTIQSSKFVTDEPVHGLRLVRRGGAAGADCPDR